MPKPSTDGPWTHRVDCGCEVRVGDDEIHFAPCERQEHHERLGRFWRMVAQATGRLYIWATLEPLRMGGRLPCGCSWDFEDNDFHVRPCPDPEHQASFEEAAREIGRQRGLAVEVEG